MSKAEKVKASVLKNLDVPAVVADMMDDILEPALKKIVKDSSNALDDVLMAAIYPTLENEVKAMAVKYWEVLLAPEMVQTIEEPAGGSPA